LLNSNDPPVFDITNENGRAPLLISCDHAENNIPDSLLDLGLDSQVLNQHIAVDIGAKEVSTLLSSMFDAPLISAGYSRLVVDLNRHLDDPSLIVSHSDGIDIPGNQNLNSESVDHRINHFFHPYHNQYASMTNRLIDQHKKPFLLSVHSFTPSMNGGTRPWEFGVLWDEPHRKMADNLLGNFSAFKELTIGNNQPYHARAPKGFSQITHAENNGIEMALIEIRQDLIQNSEGQKWAADILYTVLEPLIE
jgi:predicted N-formylglutamate amidohydrolase